MKKFYIIFNLDGTIGKYVLNTKNIEECDKYIFIFLEKVKKIMNVNKFTYEIFETKEEAKDYVWENIA